MNLWTIGTKLKLVINRFLETVKLKDSRNHWTDFTHWCRRGVVHGRPPSLSSSGRQRPDQQVARGRALSSSGDSGRRISSYRRLWLSGSGPLACLVLATSSSDWKGQPFFQPVISCTSILLWYIWPCLSRRVRWEKATRPFPADPVFFLFYPIY
jgi:hypothetical protein